MFGHEYYNWMETKDDYVIEWVEDEARIGWYYSELDHEGNFIPSIISATYPAPIDLNIPKHLREIEPKGRNLNHSFSKTDIYTNDHLYRGVVDSTLKPLIFLVEFSDQVSEYTANQFSHLLFAENLSPVSANFPSGHENYTISVRDYYDEISNGKQQIIGNIESVVDWRTAEHIYSYYVDGVQGTGQG